MKAGPIRHGTQWAYQHRGCRCDACREANRVSVMAARRRKGVPPIAEYNAQRAAAVQHGTYTKYVGHKCRCDECREWARTDRAKWRARQKERQA